MGKTGLAIVLSISMLGVLTGCATGHGKSPVAQRAAVMTVLETWKQGILERDIEMALSAVSEDFQSDRFADKAALRRGLEEAFAAGRFDDATIDLQTVQVAVEGPHATAYPVELSVAEGTRARLILRDEPEGWRIVSFQADAE